MKKIIMGLFVFVMILSANTMITNAAETENITVDTKAGTDVALGTVAELFNNNTSGTCNMGTSIIRSFANRTNGSQTITLDSVITQSMADKIKYIDIERNTYFNKECTANLEIFRNTDDIQIRDQTKFREGSLQALFDSFGQMPKLEKIFIEHINVSASIYFPESITFPAMPSLEKMEIRYLSVVPVINGSGVTSQIEHDGASLNGENFPKLKTLWLDSTVLDDYSGLGTITTLEKLTITGGYTNEINIDWIGNLVNLKDLILSIFTPDLRPIGELKSLKSLELNSYEYNSFRDGKVYKVRHG